MKKISLLGLSFIVSLSFIGCNNKTSSSNYENFINDYNDPNKESLILDIPFDEEEGKVVKEKISNLEYDIEYVFNDAYFQESRDPQRIFKSAVSGKALVFDGYSNSIEINNYNKDITNELTIDLFVAPRMFEWDDPNATFYGTQKVQSVVTTLDKDNNSGFQFGMYKYGNFVFQVGVGDRIIELWNEWNALDRYKWNHITCVWNGETGHMAMYKNGEIINFRDDAFGTFKKSNNDLYIGKSHQKEYTGVFELHMFNGGMDELKIYNKEISEEDLVNYHKSFYVNDKVKELLFEEVWLDEEIVKNDKYHPLYHATPPQHWMNEPHALFYYNGYYHLFYQFNMTGPYWRQICWGHWVSEDMVNWINVKEAIVMDESTVIKDGAWSGCASYKEDGTPVLFITAGDDARLVNTYSNQNITIAVPKDLEDPYLTEWEVNDELVAEITYEMGNSNQFRDPNVYYEDGTYYMLVGSQTRSNRGTTQVFVTKDDSFENWEYKGHLFVPPVYERYMGTCWELTNLVKLTNDKKTVSKYLFAFSPAGDNMDNDVFYYLGDFNKDTCRFIPEHEIPLRMDFGNNVFTGPTISVDPLTGRVLICSILQDQRGGRDQYRSGWAFMAGIPRELSLDDNGNLKVTPLKELNNLKGETLIHDENVTLSKLNESLNNLSETEIYMHLSIDNVSSNKASLTLKDTGMNYSIFEYDFTNNYASINTENTGSNRVKGIFGDYVVGAKKDVLDLEIFIDRGVVEIYINGYNTITAMIYDISPRMNLDVDGNIQINEIEVRKMNSIR